MGDLISRSSLIEVIKGFTNISRNYFSNPVLLEEIIKKQPTAYDVEKVVQELEESTVCGMFGAMFGKSDAEIIDIIKAGGVK